MNTLCNLILLEICLILSLGTTKAQTIEDSLCIDTCYVFDSTELANCYKSLNEYLRIRNHNDFIDQLPDLVAGKDSMFYILETEIVSVRRGFFQRSYPKKVRLEFPPERILKGKIDKLKYLQEHYRCEQAKTNTK